MLTRKLLPDLKIAVVFLILLAAIRVAPIQVIGQPPLRPIDYIVGIGFPLRLALGFRSLIPSTIASLIVYTNSFIAGESVWTVLIYAVGHAVGITVVHALAGKEPWLTTPKSVLAVLAGAAVACTITIVAVAAVIAPQTANSGPAWVRVVAGISRELSGVVALGPIVLVCLSGTMRRVCGLPSDTRAVRVSNVHWVEAVVFSGISVLMFAVAVLCRLAFGLDLAVLGFAPLVIVAGLGGTSTAAVALGAATMCGGSLWSYLGWESALSLGDLRLTVLAASITTLIMAAYTEQGLAARRRLHRRISEFRSLVARTEDARETERTRLAREVHDDVGQILTGLKMNLKMLGAGAACNPETELSTGLADLDAILARIERMGNELPQELPHDRQPLADALHQVVQQCRLRFGVPVVVEGDLISLNLGQVHAVCRVVQEALTNVARHAEARSARVRIYCNADVVCVDIEDDGKGIISSRETNGGLGITGMRERASLLGGTLEIVPGANRGTVVKLRIPRQERTAAGA